MDRNKARGLTLIDLVVANAILVVLAGILLPILPPGRDRSRQAHCAKNCRELAAAIIRYADANDGWIVKSAHPTGSGVVPWMTLLKPYHKDDPIEICPSRIAPYPDILSGGIGLSHPYICGYWDSERKLLSQIQQPSRTVVAGDAGFVRNPTAPPDKWIEERSTWIFRTPNVWYFGNERMVARHNGFANAAFLDGHVRPMKLSEIGFQYPEKHPLAMWDRF